MNIGWKMKSLNKKSISNKKVLVERLNKLCLFLEDEYNINSGGCCYIAYCIAELLKADNIEFKVIVYDYGELEDDFNDIEYGGSHYALSVDEYLINSADCENDEDFGEYIYDNVNPSSILRHYKNHDWNCYYNSDKNSFIHKVIKTFYEDLTKDLRER